MAKKNVEAVKGQQEAGTGKKPGAGRTLRAEAARGRNTAREKIRSTAASGGSDAFGRSKNSGRQVIRYDVYHLSVREWFLAAGTGIGLCGLFAYTFYRNWQAFWIFLPAAFFYPLCERRKKRQKRQLLLASQSKEGMTVLASALSAGYSVENALVASEQELILLYGPEGLITREFSGMVQQLRMNRTVEELLLDLAERSGLEDIRNFSEVFSVAKRSGGDISSIMRHTADVIGDKMQVKEEIATLTASKQFEQRIMNLIPFFIVFYVDSTSPGFFSQMYGTGLGKMLMSACLVVYLAAYVMAQKILAIEV